jgi:hypothetical protein
MGPPWHRVGWRSRSGAGLTEVDDDDAAISVVVVVSPLAQRRAGEGHFQARLLLREAVTGRGVRVTTCLMGHVSSYTPGNVMRRFAVDKYDHIDFKPPQSVAAEAEKGLEYRKKANPSDKGGLTPAEASKQGIGSGVQRATNLKNRDNVSPEVIRQMCAFFSRHEKNKGISPENKATPWKDKGHVAWLLWGGDPGKTWAEKVRDQMDRADEKADKTAAVEPLTIEQVNALPVGAVIGTRDGMTFYRHTTPGKSGWERVRSDHTGGFRSLEPPVSGPKLFVYLVKALTKEPFMVVKKASYARQANLIDHELVNDLASAYRGKRMRDSIRDMDMAGMPEPLAEHVYDVVGEHADAVRGELHRIIEASGDCGCGGGCDGNCGGGCGCGCGADCPCMKSRVARRFTARVAEKSSTTVDHLDRAIASLNLARAAANQPLASYNVQKAAVDAAGRVATVASRAAEAAGNVEAQAHARRATQAANQARRELRAQRTTTYTVADVAKHGAACAAALRG